MNSEVPKQFILLGDRPVILHTIDAFLRYDPSIELVVALQEGVQDRQGG